MRRGGRGTLKDEEGGRFRGGKKRDLHHPQLSANFGPVGQVEAGRTAIQEERDEGRKINY